MTDSFKCLLVAGLIAGILTSSPALALHSCSLHGGGQLEIVGTPLPATAAGTARFGGSISAENCHSDGDFNGHWFVRFADGSRLHVTTIDVMTVQVDGAQNVLVLGLATYRDDIGTLLMQIFETSDFGPGEIQASVRSVDDDTLLLDFIGDVERGTILIEED